MIGFVLQILSDLKDLRSSVSFKKRIVGISNFTYLCHALFSCVIKKVRDSWVSDIPLIVISTYPYGDLIRFTDSRIGRINAFRILILPYIG